MRILCLCMRLWEAEIDLAVKIKYEVCTGLRVTPTIKGKVAYKSIRNAKRRATSAKKVATHPSKEYRYVLFISTRSEIKRGYQKGYLGLLFHILSEECELARLLLG